MNEDIVISYSKLIIKIVKSVIKGESFDWSSCQNINFALLYRMAVFQRVTNIVAYAIEACEMVSDDILDKFENQKDFNIYRETMQSVMVANLLDEFEEAGIDVMPLKGYITKKLYPMADMRDSCDIDILIKQEQYEKIHEIMLKNGFTFKQESAHEYIYRIEPAIVIELHKSLVPDYNHDLYEYYADNWIFARNKEDYNHIFEMSDEDFYIYNIVHCAKHYLNSGIGFRYIIDIWLLKEQLEIDMNYVNEQLEKIGLVKFHSIITKLSKVWFCEGEHNDLTLEMEKNILMSGDSGTKQQQMNSAIYRKSSDTNFKATKLRHILSVVFIGRKQLTVKYKILDKYPLLYPFVTIYRWFDIFFNKKTKAKDYMSMVSADDSEVSKFASHCEEIGLRRTL